MYPIKSACSGLTISISDVPLWSTTAVFFLLAELKIASSCKVHFSDSNKSAIQGQTIGCKQDIIYVKRLIAFAPLSHYTNYTKCPSVTEP